MKKLLRDVAFVAAIILIPIAAGATVRFMGGLAPASIKKAAIALPTCAAQYEGTMWIQGGDPGSGVATSLCICASDGAASPAYAWCSFKMVKASAMTSTCAGGSATVCP